MATDFTNYTDDQLSESLIKLKSEIKQRKENKHNQKIREIVKKQGYYLEHPVGREIPGLEEYNLGVPVSLMSDCRSKYPDELDEEMQVTDYNIKSQDSWWQNFDGNLPEINNQDCDFQRTGDWNADDWDDPYTADGQMTLTIWYSTYGIEEPLGYGLDLNLKSEIIFWKTSEGFRYYYPTDKKDESTSDANMNQNEEKWVIENKKVAQPQSINYSGIKFIYAETVDLETHSNSLLEIIKIM